VSPHRNGPWNLEKKEEENMKSTTPHGQLAHDGFSIP
jgi:hypothetical protein